MGRLDPAGQRRRGPTGPTGATGPTGPTGATGATGPAGGALPPLYISGLWYPVFNTSTRAAVNATIYVAAFYVSVTHTFVAIGCNVSAGQTGASVELGIGYQGTTGYSGGALLGTYPSGASKVSGPVLVQLQA